MALLLLLLVSPCLRAIDLPSPDSSVVLKVLNNPLRYQVLYQGKEVVGSSAFSLLSDTPARFQEVSRTSINTNWSPVWGQFATIRDHCNELRIDLGNSVTLVCRAYNQGIGLRFQASGTLLPDSVNFRWQVALQPDDRLWYPKGEFEPVGSQPVTEFPANHTHPNMPLVVQSDQHYLALLESDLFTAVGTGKFATLSFRGNGTATLASAVGGQPTDKNDYLTPWRVVLIGKSPGDLLTNTIPLNLAMPCTWDSTDWVQPGLALWDWRVTGYHTDDFEYQIGTPNSLRFINHAARQHIPYYQMDALWFSFDEENNFVIKDAIDMDAISQRAKQKEVGLLLYYDNKGVIGDGRTRGERIPTDSLMRMYRSFGAAGIKYGFMGNDPFFTREAIIAAARNRLLVNFHDHPVPMVGVERTMPNLTTREYCHAQMDRRTAFTPTSFLKMAMVNALSGPLDQSNGVFGLNGINRGERNYGPTEPESLNATVVAEVARLLVVFSGLLILPDVPEEYAKKADLFDFIQQMPTGDCDETQVLQAALDEYIVTARRKGAKWFVGGVTNEEARQLSIPLHFLGAGAYEAVLYQDASDSHYINNREAYTVSRKEVTAQSTITAPLAPGGGFCLKLSPK